MKMPLVSVIIAAYNRPVLLRECSIPSVLAQTYPNWEVLVVGDGPEDDSLREATESFRDSRIRYVEIPRPDYSALTREQFWHTAGAAARNHGLDLSRGQVLAPLDDDDAFFERHLEESVEAIEAGADLVYGVVRRRDMETGNEWDDYFPWQAEASRERFATRNILFHSSVCYSARFGHLRYTYNGAVAGDYVMWKDIQQAGGQFTSLDTPQSVYYGDSLSSRISLKPDNPLIHRGGLTRRDALQHYRTWLRGYVSLMVDDGLGLLVPVSSAQEADYLKRRLAAYRVESTVADSEPTAGLRVPLYTGIRPEVVALTAQVLREGLLRQRSIAPVWSARVAGREEVAYAAA